MGDVGDQAVTTRVVSIDHTVQNDDEFRMLSEATTSGSLMMPRVSSKDSRQPQLASFVRLEVVGITRGRRGRCRRRRLGHAYRKGRR